MNEPTREQLEAEVRTGKYATGITIPDYILARKAQGLVAQLEADCAKMREALEKFKTMYPNSPHIIHIAGEALSGQSGTALLEEVRRLRENADRLVAALEEVLQKWRGHPDADDDLAVAKNLDGETYRDAAEALAAHRKGEKQ